MKSMILRRLLKSREVKKNPPTKVDEELIMDIEQMAVKVVNARYGFVTVFKGMVVVEDLNLNPDSYELRVGSKLFREIEYINQKNLE